MRTLICSLAFLATMIVAPLASAHAFPTKSSPAVGATLQAAPQQVKVWFDGKLEPVFSTLVVKNAAGKVVSAGKGKIVPPKHVELVTTLLPNLASGTYTAYWSVIAHDGHHTEGHFDFTVK